MPDSNSNTQQTADKSFDACELKSGYSIDTKEHAQYLDSQDPLRHVRDQFHYPKMKTLPHVDLSLVDPEDDSIYLCGNSLGLPPKTAEHLVQEEMKKWAEMGVFGHLQGSLPWALCDEKIESDMASVVGGLDGEVGIMNALTINLHLLMISFYQPTATRKKILLEGKAFPSDHYLVESHLRLHGNDPDECMVLLEPRENEQCLRTEYIVSVLREQGDEIAVVLLPGVQYYTGQVFDMATITREAQNKGCIVGWDLAHAVGNVELHLHDWNVDFAAWCSYKYLNSGAGGIAGAFLHSRHAHHDGPRLTGWWSHQMKTRFNMDNSMELQPGIHGFRVSNPPGLLCATLKASLQIFTSVSITDIRAKSRRLTSYLEQLLLKTFPHSPTIPNDTPVGTTPSIHILTPSGRERGAQLSIAFSCDLSSVFDQLVKRGVACDKRLPHVLRIATTGLYNSYYDVWRFVQVLQESLQAVNSPTSQ